MAKPIVAVESLLDENELRRFWPPEIIENKGFQNWQKKRLELLNLLDAITSRLPRPDTPLADAIGNGDISQGLATAFYNALGDFIGSEPEYQSIVLYIPFELLAGDFPAANDELRQAVGRFNKCYMDAWEKMLGFRDARASYSDGDIVEKINGGGNTPQVVKAAHLIPKLIAGGLMKTSEAITLMANNPDEVLKESIADALRVAADLGLVSDADISIMKASKDHLSRGMAAIISSDKRKKTCATNPPPVTIPTDSLFDNLAKDLAIVETADYGNITASRKKWLKAVAKQNAIDSHAKIIAAAIIKRSLSLYRVPKINTANNACMAAAIRIAIETAAAKNLEQAQRIYARNEGALFDLKTDPNQLAQVEVIKTFNRLYRLGIIDRELLERFGIVIPKLAGPFSDNLKLVQSEVNSIERMIAAFRSDPELSRMMYPVIIVFGSVLKGYGAQNSDIDIAVFVRPETSFDEKEKLRRLLEKFILHPRIHDRPVEFWLENDGENDLRVRKLDCPDVFIAEPHWTHVLFGGAWIGNETSIRELFAKLLLPYLRANNLTRDRHICELERDFLLYRLLQKGYDKYYPRFGGIHTPHSSEIDNNSAFWDSGYRFIATRLFIANVFLPQIE